MLRSLLMFRCTWPAPKAVMLTAALCFSCMFFFLGARAATYYSRVSGTFNTPGTWSVNPSGTPTNATALANTDIFIIQSDDVVTMGASRTVAQITINSGGTLALATFVLTVSGAWTNNGAITGSTGQLSSTTGTLTNNGSITLTGAGGIIKTTGVLTNSGTGTIDIGGTGTITMGTGNFVNLNASSAVDFGSSVLTITGTTATQSVGGFVSTGRLASTKTGGTLTLTGDITCGGITVNGAGGTLNLGAGLEHTSTGQVQLLAGTMNGGSSALFVSMVNANAWRGTGTVFVPGSSTIVFNGAGAQTLSATGTKTFYNLTIAGSGTKTTANTTVTNVLTMEGSSTVSAAPTYGAAATLVYNTTANRTAGVEWLATTAATGGVTISGTGIITMNNAKTFSAGAPLVINTDASLSANNLGLTLSDDFINNGTWVSSTNVLTVTGTANQSIGSFSTTGGFASTKTGGTATFSGNANMRMLNMSTAGGTVNLGAGFTHDVSGNVVLTNGTLNGATSTLRVAGSWIGTGTVFTPATGTVDFDGGGTQTLSASGTKTFYNLTYSSGGAKNTSAGTTLVNRLLSIEDAATATGTAVTYGANGGLIYNNATTRTAGAEWLTPFAGTGGVTLSTTGTITLNADKTFSSGAPFTINVGGVFSASTFDMVFNDDFINNGTWNTSSGDVTVTGSNAQSVGSFSTTGSFNMTKTTGTATVAGDLNMGGFVLNGGGTLDFGTNNSLVIAGIFTCTAGVMNANNSTIVFGGALVATGGTFVAGTGLAHFRSSIAQVVPGINWWDLMFSGSGLKTFNGNTNVYNVMTVNNGATVDLGSILLQLGGSEPIVNNGTINTSTSTVGYAVGITQTVAPLSYYNLDCSVGGGARILSTTGTIGIAGVFTPGGAPFTVVGSTVDFNGGSDQVIPAFTFDKLIVSNNGIKKILATIIVACMSIDIMDTASVEINADGAGKLNVMQ